MSVNGPTPDVHRAEVAFVASAGDDAGALVIRDALVRASFVLLTSEQLAEVAADRVIIEQAKGMSMFVYGIEADDAFEILRFHSQEYNIKLRLIARQIVHDMISVSVSKGPARLVQFDGLMLTAHERIAAVAARQQDRLVVLTTDVGDGVVR